MKHGALFNHYVLTESITTYVWAVITLTHHASFIFYATIERQGLSMESSV